MTLDFLAQPFWQRLSIVLVHFVWQGLAVAVVLAAVMAVWRPGSAASRYAAYLIAFLALPACALVTLAVTTVSPPVNLGSADAAPIGSGSAREGSGADAVSADRAETRSSAGQTVAGRPPLAPRGTLASHRADSTRESGARATQDLRRETPSGVPVSQTLLAWRSALATWLLRLRPWLIVGWLAGVGIFSLRLVLGAVVIAWIMHRAGAVQSELLERARRISRRLGVRAPRIVASGHVRQALATGLFRPVIVLPAAWATGLSPEVAEAVLAHELAHLRRHDVWLNLVQRLVETVFFYHPVVWWLSARVRAERELCCDDLAVAATGDRLGYATALELAAGGPCPARDLLLANGIGGRKMAVLERVRRVLNLETDAGRQRWWPGGAAALAVPALVWCASAAWQPALAGGDQVALVQEDDREGDAREGARRAEEAARRANDEQQRNREAAERERDRDRQAGERRDREGGPRDGEDRGPRRLGDGDRPAGFGGGFGPRDRERPEFPRRDGERPDGERSRDPRPVGPERDSAFGPRGDLPPAQRELLELVRQLRQEVEELRREVRELRDSRPRGPFPGGPPGIQRGGLDDGQRREFGRGPFPDGPPRLRDGEPGDRQDGERGEFRGPPRRPDPPAGPFGPGRNPFGRRPDRDPTDRERDEREREDGERESPERDAEDPRPERDQDRARDTAFDLTPREAFSYFFGFAR